MRASQSPERSPPVRIPALTACCLALAAASPALAENLAELVDTYARAAKAADPAFAGLSAKRGSQFFAATHGREWSCSTCHTANPTVPGKHASTGKAIAPLAPSAAPERFTDAARAEKWFRRNCNDVAGRECTPQEKGDILAWLVTLK
jgi:hypothetical protein